MATSLEAGLRDGVEARGLLLGGGVFARNLDVLGFEELGNRLAQLRAALVPELDAIFLELDQGRLVGSREDLVRGSYLAP